MATGQILFPVSDEQGNESLGSCDLTVGEPGEITHGSQITTANTGWQGLGLTLGQLTPSGSITTSSNGQVIEGLDISGQVNINHDNVTVRGCRVTASVGANGVKINSPAGGARIEWCEIWTPGAGNNLFGVRAVHNVASSKGINSIFRCYIHEFGHTSHVSGGGYETVECYMRTGAVIGGQHNDGLFVAKAAPNHSPAQRLDRCRIIMGSEDGSSIGGTAGLWVNTQMGDVGDCEFNDNWVQCSRVSIGISLQGNHPSNPTPNFVGVTNITGNWIVQGWPPSDPGPENFIRLEDAGVVNRSGNRIVDIDGNDLGPVPGG